MLPYREHSFLKLLESGEIELLGSSYYKNLMMNVIRCSESNNWQDAVQEWDIIDCDEDLRCSSVCICGKENIKYLYTIKNRYNGKILYPIEGSCINKFERNDLSDVTSLMGSNFRLLHAVEVF